MICLLFDPPLRLTRPFILIKTSNLIRQKKKTTAASCRKRPTQSDQPPLQRRGCFIHLKNPYWVGDLFSSVNKQCPGVFRLFVCLVFHFRLMEAFVSIQLGKVSLRDEMLNSFVKKSQATRGGVTAAVSGASRTKQSGSAASDEVHK